MGKLPNFKEMKDLLKALKQNCQPHETSSVPVSIGATRTRIANFYRQLWRFLLKIEISETKNIDALQFIFEVEKYNL